MTQPTITNRPINPSSAEPDPPNASGARSEWLSRSAWVLTAAVGLFLISSGVTKFGESHVFQYMEYQSGIDFFDPFVAYAVGAAEILAGVGILFRRTRPAGATLALAIMVGAVAFHLTPWLGIAIPTGFTDGAAAPWGAEDFTTTTTVVPFVLAVLTEIGAFAIVWSDCRARRAAAARPKPGKSARATAS